VKYESKKLEREHYLYNIPDQDIDGLNDRIVGDLIAAGVGTRPFLIVSYSMGGVVTRHIILKQLTSDRSLMREKFAKNFKGVAFIASPLKGSTMRDEINEDMKCLIPVMNKSLIPHDPIKDHEYLHHFMESGFPLSKMTLHIDGKADFHTQNEAFLALKIPYICLAESEKTLLPIVGKKYFYVHPDCAILEKDKPETYKVIMGKTHGTV